MCYSHYLICVILNLPMHHMDAQLLHFNYLVAKKTLQSLVGMYAIRTEVLPDQSILNG